MFEKRRRSEVLLDSVLGIIVRTKGAQASRYLLNLSEHLPKMAASSESNKEAEKNKVRVQQLIMNQPVTS